MNKNTTFPIFLIVFGFMILFHNLELIDFPDIFNLFRKFWPVILIWIGFDKIYKIYNQKGE